MLVKGSKKTIKNLRSILIIQLGDIGDVVWVTPTLRAVKEKYPGAKISILVRDGYGTLLEEDISLHKIFEVRPYKGSILKKALKQIEFIKDLRQERFDLVLDLRADDRGAITAYLTGAPMRASMFYRNVPFWRNMLFTHLADPPAPQQRVLGAAEQSLRIVREFGIDTENTVPKLWISENVRKQVRQFLDNEVGLDTNQWISLNPFSRWQYKEWGYDKWVQIIDWVWDKYGFATVVVGSPQEKSKAFELVKKCRGKAYNTAGKTTLGELAGLLSMSSLHVGVDSAAPHIAAAVGVPTITIYGPSDWMDWAPPGDMHRVVTPDYDCAPCHQKGCNSTGSSKCLENLRTDKVKKAIQVMMETLSPR